MKGDVGWSRASTCTVTANGKIAKILSGPLLEHMSEACDYIVVGAGSAGAVVAARPVRRP
jgi:hypothetical protein